MGKFFNNIKGQIGRDTGKAISGFLYGDKHATVYRRVGDSTRRRETNEEKKERVERERIDAELSVLDNEIQQKIELILDKEIPQDRNHLTFYLINLSAELYAHSWKFGNDGKNAILNKYPDTLYLKLKQGLSLLEGNYPDCEKISTFKKKLQKYRNERFIKKNITFIGIGLFFSILGISLLISEIMKLTLKL